ncbi:malectin domain-containing carbohydrate-binding protein [Adhaeribacter radiodurans]|uniref:Choice-of-anchor D domain-containing protein n=1 Tax=Adhaeribacter radiodurans TaxID=2745197 RepID=A0A7L7L525_9BACT|nr:malectin domain-containing carbohydrate-binding protein [Adhaeribacter radiodurans]QMU27911.1 choice-of-anchor D domain-containing protein [Adhaeribacter radiodurans]
MKKLSTFPFNLSKSQPLFYLFFSVFLLFGSLISLEGSAQTIAVENTDKFPALDQMVLSRVQNPWRRQNLDGTYTPYNANHDKVKLKIYNRGSSTLTISKFTLSSTSRWKITLPKALPISVSAGSSIETTVEFIAKDQATRVKVLHDLLTITSNDKTTPSKVVKLHGLWQKGGEGNREPWAQEIINAFGYTTKTGYAQHDGDSDGDYTVPNSDEILSANFVRVDGSKPVTVTQLGAYHGCCYYGEKIAWYPKGTNNVAIATSHYFLDSQSLLPRKTGSSSAIAQGTFNPSGAFGFKVGSAYSDRAKNFENKIGMRIWKAVDANGKIIANAYIIGADYLGTEFTNYDYQDNVYYVTNIRPESGQVNVELAVTPSDRDFGSVLKGSTKTLSVTLKNSGRSGQSSIKISSVALSGPNKAEFIAKAISTTLAPQASISASVSFKPTAKGIKNAALLVYHNAPGSPLRIPLYGIANESGSTITVVKRVKGGSDASMTIAGKVWESDKNYRKGSVRLDKQVTPGPISATDQDVLYQTYLSATQNLAETRVEIPMANGSYYVRLHFAENYFPSNNSRVFNINIEGTNRLTGFDIHKEVGYRSALVKDFAVTVSGGVLNLKFNPTVNRLALCGVEIFKSSSGSAANTISDLNLTDNVGEEMKDLQLKVYPNPSNGEKVFVEASNFAQQEEVTLSLHDLVGHTIEVKTLVTDENGSVSTQMATNKQLSSGLYILRGRGAISGETQSRLVIE